jgi:hypothetical protein
LVSNWNRKAYEYGLTIGDDLGGSYLTIPRLAVSIKRPFDGYVYHWSVDTATERIIFNNREGPWSRSEAYTILTGYTGPPH